MKKSIVWLLVIIILIIIPTVVNLATLYTDFLWFAQIGYKAVFIKIILTRIKLGTVLGFVFFAFMLANIIVADRLSRKGFIKLGNDSIELPGSDTLVKSIRSVLITASAFLAFVIGVEASSRWDMFLRYLNPMPFGIADPLFGRDISFYVFKLPMINYIYQWLFVLVVFGLIISIAVYGYKRGFVLSSSGIHIRSSLYGHLSILFAAGLLLKAAGYRLLALNMLMSSRGFVQGPGYTDVHVRLPMLTLLSVVAIVAAVMFAANIIARGWKLPAAAAALLLVVSLAGSVLPEVFQRLRVTPNEISMEREFIRNQIKFTRAAYDINRMVETPFEADMSLTPKQIERNSLTLKNIRLWDSRPILQSYRQLQEIRTYYGFSGTDIDRYHVNGEYRQVMVSAREIEYDKLPSKNWINERLAFTHGYGVVMSPVNRFTPEGMPDFFIKDIPPVSSTDIKVTRPQIYYGESTNDYVFTKTFNPQFDFPLGEKNVRSVYKGGGGVPVKSLFNKLAFAIRFSSLATILNTDITNSSRVMMNRNVSSIAAGSGLAAKIMPLISYDTDPYIVIDSQGHLKWIIDGYTLSGSYPYSESYSTNPVAEFNYIRNSVKVVIDAYDGTTTFYLFDNSDPIIKSYQKIFPGVFRAQSDMPADLLAHVRYPVDYFKVQSKIYMAYHMTDPSVFYNKEDLQTYPREMFYQSEQIIEPYYTIMKLPDGEKEEFVLMLPLTPSKRDNISAWLCARNDGEHYGELLVYKFPKKKLIFGPFQIEARIDQDSEISKQFTLWGQGGSQIIRGNMLVIPIEKSLLYVEPIYLKAEQGEIPELKRVIASIGNQLVMEDNLEAAISKLTGAAVSSESQTTSTPRTGSATSRISASVDEIIKTGLQHIENAKKNIRSLDWNGFGSEIDAAEKTLRSYFEKEKAKPAAEPAGSKK